MILQTLESFKTIVLKVVTAPATAYIFWQVFALMLSNITKIVTLGATTYLDIAQSGSENVCQFHLWSIANIFPGLVEHIYLWIGLTAVQPLMLAFPGFTVPRTHLISFSLRICRLDFVRFIRFEIFWELLRIRCGGLSAIFLQRFHHLVYLYFAIE